MSLACVRGTLLQKRQHLAPSLCVVFQNLKQQYYTGYTENDVLEVMQHMAKNIVKVNENLTKFIVSTLSYAEKSIRLWVLCLRVCVYVCLCFHVNFLAYVRVYFSINSCFSSTAVDGAY